jgi:hypothetical protein
MPFTSSSNSPPRYVEYSSALPVGFSLVTNPSSVPARVGSTAPGVIGKRAVVTPVTYALPEALIAMASPLVLPPSPPRYVEYSSALPAGFSFVTNALPMPLALVSNAPDVVGKSGEPVRPVRYALPMASTAISTAVSSLIPPRKVEYSSAVPEGFSFITYASWLPLGVTSNAPGVVGNSDAAKPPVLPTTYALPEPSTAIPLERLRSPFVPRYVE